jgi:hypothetical protein
VETTAAPVPAVKKVTGRGMFLVGFPLLIVPFVLYNMITFLTGLSWTQEVARIHMLSGADFVLTPGDIFITLSVLLLFGEMLKSTKMSSRAIVDHMLSTLLLIGILVEFLLVPQAATATFFMLLVISFVDVVGGFTITIRTAQRDISLDSDRIQSV